jgi:hypothetical protein
MTTTPQGSTHSADDQPSQDCYQRVGVGVDRRAQSSETEPAERRDDVFVGIDDDADRATRDPEGVDRIAGAQTKQANP